MSSSKAPPLISRPRTKWLTPTCLAARSPNLEVSSEDCARTRVVRRRLWHHDQAKRPTAPVVGRADQRWQRARALSDGHHAVVADPDRDRLMVVDLDAGTTVEIALQAGDEPGRLVQDAAGRVHVALRRGGALLTING